ncbi:hypothetical protein BL254_22865 [Protofrankia sp. BMG5.30]|nr:hypothetical protein BL254_22865 [Protofrankia sp. BMG5.30]
MYLVLVAGVALAYLTGDLFNLFVAFEVMLVSSYVLITLDTTPGRIRAGMTYVIVSMTSSLLFLTMLALVYASTGTVNLADLAARVGGLPTGLAAAVPVTAVLFAMPALSLAGIPPFSGFVAKMALLQAGSQVGSWLVYVAVGAGLLTSLLTLYVMVRVWSLAFWGTRRAAVPDLEPEDDLLVGTERVNRPMILATGGVVAVGLAVALFAGPLLALSGRAADDLLEPSGYVESVLPARAPAGAAR